MPQLSPNENFPVVRVLEDHTDASTNYVQAVVRDANTDAVLATLNLTDLGNRRFRYVWKVPYDNVFQIGRYVVITTTVYTDSGYTLKNTNYAEKGETYLIQERWNSSKFIMGGGDSVDYKKMEGLLASAIKSIAFPEQVAPQNIDIESLISRIMGHITTQAQGIHSKIDAIPEVEPPEKIDFSPILKLITTLEKSIAALPQKQSDLTPVIEQVRQAAAGVHGAVVAAHNNLVARADKTDKLIQAKNDTTIVHKMEVSNPVDKRMAHLEGLKRKHGIKN